MKNRTSINTTENELALMRQELNELREAFTAFRNGNTRIPAAAQSDPITDRRGMLKKVAGLAIGAASVGLLKPVSSRAAGGQHEFSPDANGDALIMGQINQATSNTLVEQNTGSRFIVENLSPTVMNTGANLWGRNSTAAQAFPQNSFGIGVLGSASPDGTTTTDADVVGVFGESHTSGNGSSTGVRGEGTQLGVLGIANGTNGCGVAAFADSGTSAHAVDGSSATGSGGAFQGARSAIFLSAGTAAISNPNDGPPSGAATGDLYRSSDNGGLWYRAASGSNSYRRLADNTTAGALTFLAAPQRVVDTRTGSGFFDAGNHYVNDTLRTYNIMTLATPDLPTATRGIIGRITIVNATAAGVIQESPNAPGGAGNDLGQGTAVLIYPAATVIPSFGATFVSALSSSGQIRVRGFMAGGGTVDVIIDIIGFYL